MLLGGTAGLRGKAGTKRRRLWEDEVAAAVAGNSDWGSGKEGQGLACVLDLPSVAEEEALCVFFLLFFCR